MLAESLRYIDKRGRESKPTLHGKQAFEAMGVLGGGGYNPVPTAAQELSHVKEWDESLVTGNSTIILDNLSKSPIKDTSNPPTISASGSVAEELSEFPNALHVLEESKEEFEKLLENDVTTIICEQCAVEALWVFNPALLVSKALQKYYPDCTVTTLSYKDLKNYKFMIDIPDTGLFMVTRMDGTLNMEFYYVKGTDAESTFDVRMNVLKVISNEEMIAERYLQLLARTRDSETTEQKLEFAALVDARFVIEDFVYHLFGGNYEIKTLFFKDSRNWQFMITVNEDVYIMTSYGCGADAFAFCDNPELDNFVKSFQGYFYSGGIDRFLNTDKGDNLKLLLAHADIQEKIKAISTIQEFSGKLALTSSVDDVKWRVGCSGRFWNSVALLKIFCSDYLTTIFASYFCLCRAYLSRADSRE